MVIIATAAAAAVSMRVTVVSMRVLYASPSAKFSNFDTVTLFRLATTLRLAAGLTTVPVEGAAPEGSGSNS